MSIKTSGHNGCESEVINIRTVAGKAGVSIGTVSRVLNNKNGVGAETRQRVFAVAQELGYRLSGRVTSTAAEILHFGFLNRPLAGGLMSNPFYYDVFIGVEQACRENNITLSVSRLNIANDLLQAIPPLLRQEHLSGLILVGAIPERVVSALVAQTGLPAVLVDNHLPRFQVDTVMIDNDQGIRLALEHLVALGHQQLSFIGGPDHPSIVERRQAYLSSLQQYGLVPFVVRQGLEVEGGALGVAEIIRQRPETTAILCANDMQAIGAVRQLQQLGYRVPEDFSVVGFDDVELTRITSPAITTIQVERTGLGQIATQTLLARLRDPGRPVVTTRVGVRWMERASVAPPRT
jgi:LacI family transcriptional regulator